jgi:hypothetical protein
VSRVYREGRKLLADFTDIPKVVYEAIKSGLYKFVSVELLGGVKAGTREIPWVLDAVALLGADPPAVGTLKDLQSLTMARSSGLQGRARVAFTRDSNPLTGAKPNMAGENDDLKAILQRLADAEKERDALKIKAAQTETFERDLNELKAKTHADKVTSHRAKLMELFEAPIKDKKILPAAREQFKRVYKTETDAVLDVTSADVEIFIKANPNPDYRPAPASLGGVDPNAPEEKAIAFARSRVNEDRSGKPRDQVLVEAIQAQMRQNPDLGKAWQDAPGRIATN